MKMEHYLCHTDYPIWQVIQNGNGLVSVTTDTNGMIKVLPPKTAEEVVARERERKARTTLLMALHEDHLAKFHKMADAKEILVKNIEAGVPFYIFLRFVQLIVDHQLWDMSHHQDIYDNPLLSKKVFANMKRVGTGFYGVITPLFENMLVPATEEVGQAQDDVSIPTEPSTSKPHKKHKSKKQQPKAPMVPSLKPSPEHQLPSPPNDQIPTAKDSLTLQKLMDLCTRLSNKVLDLESEVIDIKSSFTDRIQKLEDRGRMIADMDEDVEEEPAEVEEVLEVVKAAKLITEVVTTTAPTTTAAQVPKASAPRRRRGVVIQDTDETSASLIVHAEADEAFARQLEAELNANINWNDVVDQVKRSDRQNNKVMRYQALKKKPLTEARAKKNMMIYLKNMAGFKMNFFKGMTYSKIRPLFEKHYNFLERVEEEVTIQEKRQDGTHKLFLSFITLLKNFDREDLETLWKLVKKRFETTEPKNFSNDFLLNILNIMFEKPDIKANVWKDQKGRYGLAKVKSWKLFESCGVHIITFTTTQLILLVEKKYLLTHFTLQQMLDNVRLKVEEESEMSLELLRLVRRQLNEGYVPE
nr:xylulose kinase-1 [Tanacetum cinerariifolium]